MRARLHGVGVRPRRPHLRAKLRLGDARPLTRPHKLTADLPERPPLGGRGRDALSAHGRGRARPRPPQVPRMGSGRGVEASGGAAAAWGADGGSRCVRCSVWGPQHSLSRFATRTDVRRMSLVRLPSKHGLLVRTLVATCGDAFCTFSATCKTYNPLAWAPSTRSSARTSVATTLLRWRCAPAGMVPRYAKTYMSRTSWSDVGLVGAAIWRDIGYLRSDSWAQAEKARSPPGLREEIKHLSEHTAGGLAFGRCGSAAWGEARGGAWGGGGRSLGRGLFAPAAAWASRTYSLWSSALWS